jgi:hypothetical protein
MSGQLEALAALSPEKGVLYPLERRLDVLQSRYGRYGGVNILDPTWTRTPTPP